MSICADVELPDRKIRVLFVGPYPPPDHGTSIPFGSLVEYARSVPGMEVSVLNTQSGDKTGKSIFSMGVALPFAKISTELFRRRHSFDAAVINGSQRYVATAGAIHAAILSRITGRHVGIYVAGGSFDEYFRSLPRASKAFVRACLNCAGTLVVQTNLSAANLRSDFRRIAVVPNWVDAVGFRQASRLSPALSPGGTPRRVLELAFVGEVIPEKGIVELVRAVQSAGLALGDTNRPMVLNVFGPMRAKSAVAMTMLFNDHAHFVRYHGSLPHDALIRKLAECDMMALPTRFPSEGYPGVILEAMALGVPVIASRFRAIPEIVTDGETGLLCEPGDIGSLAECLKKLAVEDDYRSVLARNALDFVQRFDKRRVLSELLKAFELPFPAGDTEEPADFVPALRMAEGF